MKKIASLLVLILCTITIMAQETIAVFVYSTNKLNEPTAALRSSIVNALVNGVNEKYNVLDRSDEFLKTLGMELSYQEQGYVSNNQMTLVGQQLGATKVCAVVITDYGKDGGGYMFECSIIDIKTGVVDAHADYPNGKDPYVYQINIVNSRNVANSLAKRLNLLSDPAPKQSTLPTFVYNGVTYMVAPDPGEPMIYKMAKSYCDNLTLEGYADWVMPTEEQYNMMYLNKKTIGGFFNQYYWTFSTDYCGSSGNTFYVCPHIFSFYDASIICECKGDELKHRVRPIRKVND